MTSIGHDLRIAVRSLLKNPGFTAVVVLALSLGLAVNIGVFGIVNEVVLRPLPVAQPQQLAAVFIGPVTSPQAWGGVSHPEFLRLREERQIFSGVVASAPDEWIFNDGLGRGGRPVENGGLSWGEYLNHDAFDVLGVHPVLGRAFSAQEDRPGGDPVIVLSHRLWRTRFQADPAVIGRKVYLNAGALTVVGVMPASFHGVRPFPFARDGLQYWVPLGQRGTQSGLPADWITDRSHRELTVRGRLQPGVTLAQAQARLELLLRTLAQESPATSAGLRINVTGEIEGRHGDSYATVKLASRLALGVAGLVLLICCANVANLMLARTARRGRELGIRLALGASRGRLIRLLLTESLLLAAVSGGVGLGLAFWFGDLLIILLPALPPGATLDLGADLWTGLWAVAAALLAGLGFGLLPAWRASRGSLMAVMKTDLRTQGHRLRRPGLRQLLVVAQLAISLVVLASGGLFLRSLQRIEAIDPGYQPKNLVSALVNPGMFTDDRAVVRRFYDQLMPRLEQLPGVESVSATLYMPLVNPGGSCGPIIKEGDPPPPPNQGKPAVYSVISEHYFETMGTKLLRGRDFTRAERRDPPDTVIINATLARQLFGSEESALERRFRIGGLDSAPLRIVGVARDGHYMSLLEEPKPALYLPGFAPELHDELWAMKTVILRGRDQASLPGLIAGLRAEVARVDPRVPLDGLSIAGGHLLGSLIQTRLAVGLGMILGILALGLATMGIYSVMTYTVGQRTREIGIRIALGGQVSDVVRLVVGQGLGLIGVGIVLGSLGAWVVARSLEALLYGVSSSDPGTYLGTVVLLLVVAVLATLLPARRAARVDPMIALRAE